MAATTTTSSSSSTTSPTTTTTTSTASGISSPLGVKSLLILTVLLLACLAGFLSRLFAVIRFGSIIHEYDPCGLSVIATYLLTKEVWSSGAGLFAACFMAIVPGYTSRSVACSYDNEGIAIFALMLTYYLWVKSVKKGSVFWASTASLSYLYMVSAWGGYVYIINLTALHVFVLLLMGRFSYRLYTAYNTFYILGLICSMQISFVGFQPITTSEHMAAAGVFVLLNAWALLKYLHSVMTNAEFTRFFLGVTCVGAGGVFLVVVGLSWMGVVAPWSGRIYSLWNTGQAIPIIASVAEHQLITWFKFVFDLHILAATFPVGLWYCVKNINDERVFTIVLTAYGHDGTREIIDDFREGYSWLSHNTAVDAKIMSWWDYGYQIAGMANRTTIVDNNTSNNSHIALVGKAMASNESTAHRIMTALDVDYVLVIFGGVISYSGDDINKFPWMVSIAQGEHPEEIKKSDYGAFQVDSQGSSTLLNCLMYKLSYYQFGNLVLDYRSPPGFDRIRNVVIGNKDFKLTYLEEAYTTEHWMVRIYRVKKSEEVNIRPRIPVTQRKVTGKNVYLTKKVRTRDDNNR
ncbi:hypothetical protein Pcinc_005967 [Petrolisthes cinctipes]|uniref:dolichyl-diphosphooligosaccharide--protein glycotransferase n=1 Tax=Petrolisthes cinctipes TaxID=88211 RepID=A0AAE1GCF8_PETCI|nr:hypothetical protein Pcinc_005967 [Petrolisthes cinctipes]